MESFAQLVSEDPPLSWCMEQQQTDHSAAQLASRSDELEELRIALKVLLQHKESDKKP